jgi:CO/xanthine dehydrogenase FAD-binding subunit
LHPIQYEAPSSIEQAIGLLATYGEKARPMCGGTDLIIQLRAGTRRPDYVIDVKHIADLRRISFEASTGLRLGAAVPCIEIYESQLMRRHYPGLTEAAHLIGSLQIQSRASVGGNLCNGSPAADTTPALIALGAEARVLGPKGERLIKVEDFVLAPGRTALQPGELVVDLRVAPPPAHSADAYLRFIPRNEMDIAVVGVGAAVTLDGKRCVAARIGLGAVAARPLLAERASASLIGKEMGPAAYAEAAALAQEASSPIDDMRGTAEFRRHLVGVLTQRVLEIAVLRACQN